MTNSMNQADHALTAFILLLFLTLASAASASRKKFLGCNWKCNLESVKDVDDLVADLNRLWRSFPHKSKVELCVHPPYIYLDRVRQKLLPGILVGSQNLYDSTSPNQGNTGACSAAMLKSVGCDHVLVGHSDRRNNLGETDALIADKIRLALDAGLNIVLTVGELKYQRRLGMAVSTLQRQLRVAATAIDPQDWHKIVIAYEPVWAIGDGATPCLPQEARRICKQMKRWIECNVSLEAAQACRITYTGSVSDDNAADYASLVDGFVVGRAGLDAKRLERILQALALAATEK